MIQIPAGAIQPRIPRPLTEDEKSRINNRRHMQYLVRSSIAAQVEPIVQLWLNEQVATLRAVPFWNR